MPIPILQLDAGHLVLQGVGVFHVTYGTLDAAHIGGHALVALTAHAGRPGHRLVVAHLALPLGADLAQIVGIDPGGAGTV